MDRRGFLVGTAASAAAASAAGASVARDDAGLALLTAAADRQAALVLAAPGARDLAPRATLRQMRRLLSVFVWSQSTYTRAEALKAPMEQLLAAVEASQHDDGTFSAGNRHSPPDTAFLIRDMATMVGMLRHHPRPMGQGVSARLVAMMRKAGPALVVGGVHTPNHRWELSAALADIDEVDPNPAYRRRIDEWLGEGVDIDADGFYSERSSNYAANVSNPSLLRLARLPGLAGLRDLVRRNLDATLDLAEPSGGEVETVQSRRQDQDQRRHTLHAYYLPLRELALLDRSSRFAGAVRWIERNDSSRLGDVLAEVVARPALSLPLPADAPPFADVTRHFETVGLVRQRRGATTASIYAGSDWYDDGRPSAFYNTIGSGLATNPTLMRLWKGGLAVEAIRLIPDFFDMGPFRPATITLGADQTVRLAGEVRVPYYQPLPAARRRPDGAYALGRSTDGRFHSALEFDQRATTSRQLDVRIAIRPDAAGYRVLFEVDGEQDVDLTIEVTLRAGGDLDGARRLDDGGYHLTAGEAVYRLGGEQLRIGPGNGAGVVKAASGESYAWAGGRLQVPGTRLYVTGRTPLRYELRLAFA